MRFHLALAAATLLCGTGLSGAEEAKAVCAGATLAECVVSDPETAYEQIQLELVAGDAAQALHRLGDLHAGPSRFHDPALALANWRKAYEAGNLWAGVSLAKGLLAGIDGEIDADGAIDVLRAATARSEDVRKWASKTLGDALIARAGPGDRDAGMTAYATALSLSNPWAAIPLATAVAEGENVPVADEALIGVLRSGVTSDPTFVDGGTKALSALLLARGREAEGIEQLRVLASRPGDTGETARLALGKRLAATKTGREEGEGLLREVAANGSSKADLALADVAAGAASTPRERKAAVARYVAIAEEDPSVSSTMDVRIGDVLIKGDAAEAAMAAYRWKRAVANGNKWAHLRLSKAYRTGVGVPKSVRQARVEVEKAFAAGVGASAVNGFLSLHGTPAALDGPSLVDLVRRVGETSSPGEIAQAMEWAPVGAKVLFLQQAWKDRGLYSGEVDGLSGPATRQAHVAACGEEVCGASVAARQTIEEAVSTLLSPKPPEMSAELRIAP